MEVIPGEGADESLFCNLACFVLVYSRSYPKSSKEGKTRAKKERRARDTLLLPSRVSLSRARSFLRLLCRLLLLGGVTPLYKPYRYLIT